MNRKIALIPVDGRPVTRELPTQIASISGWEVLVPDHSILGFLKEPADLEKLFRWVEEVAPHVNGFVISIDMLAYGGLVPSRISIAKVETIKERINVLQKLKSLYPDKLIMAFSATMRISNNYVNEEEKNYWSDYGEEIWSCSYHTHRYLKTNETKSKEKMDELKSRIPEEILNDYIDTRKRNFSINLSLLEVVEEDIIDILIFPQDDTAEYGLNILEQEKLSEEIRQRGLTDRVLIYPGADEVSNVLIARMIYDLEQIPFPTYFPIYSGEKGALSTAMYEDRPIKESVKGQVYAFGSFTVDMPSDADIILAVNVPGKRQGDLALQKYLGEVDTQDRNIGEWQRKISYYLSQDRKVAVCDLAYANGADVLLFPKIIEWIDRLTGYAAWNTAGNTIGTVVAQAAMVHLQKEKGIIEQSENKRRLTENLLLRLLDDYLFQAVVRQEVRQQIDEEMISKVELLEIVKEKFGSAFERFIKQPQLEDIINKYEIHLKDVYLPWDRTFEIGLSIKVIEREVRL